LKSCILGSLGGGIRQRLERNFVFRCLFVYPPKLLLSVSRTLREDHSLVIAVKSAISVLAVAALAAGIFFWESLVQPADGFALKWFLALFVAPVAALYMLWLARTERGVGLTAALLGLVSGIYAGRQLVQITDALGFHQGGIALQFAGNAARASELVRQIGPIGVREQLAADSSYIIPAYVAVFVAFGIWILARLPGRWRWLGAAVVALTFSGAAADRVENSRMLSMLEAITDAAVQEVQNASRFKWGVLSLLLGCLAIASCRYAWTSFNSGRKSGGLLASFTGLAGLLSAGIGMYSVYAVSPEIEYAFLGMTLSITLMGISIFRNADHGIKS
jgi:hypothetical protein